MESSLCGWIWTSGLWRFPGWEFLCLCSGGGSWISSLWRAMKCYGLVWLWTACLLKFNVMFLFFWRISTGTWFPWVDFGLSIGMEGFDGLSSIHFLWYQEFYDCLKFWSWTSYFWVSVLTSYSGIKTSLSTQDWRQNPWLMIVKQLSTARNTQRH